MDVSPLRTRNIEWVNTSIENILRSDRYDSLVSYNDFSDIDELGWDSSMFDNYFIEQPIWRIPVHGLSITFHGRNDSRDFAKELATAICAR